MTFTFAKILLVAVIASQSVLAVDRTLVANEKGSDVVEGVVDKIERSRVFPEDFGVLRRTAWVETRDGDDQSSYLPNALGGIWNVTSVHLYRTKDPVLASYHTLIQDRFDVTWGSVTEDDLLIPLHSGIAARLYFAWLQDQQPACQSPATIADQASCWARHYRLGGGADPAIFVTDTKDFEISQPTCTGKLDLFVAFYGTNCINSLNPEKQFVIDLFRGFSLEENRFGYLVYNWYGYAAFVPSQSYSHDTMATYITAQSCGGDTEVKTYTALRLAKLFHNGADVRPGVPRVVSVFTPSRAYEEDTTGEYKNDTLDGLKTSGFHVFPVGISAGADTAELEDMTIGGRSRPYVFESAEVRRDSLIRYKRSLCKLPQTPDLSVLTQHTVKRGETRYFEFQRPAEGLTITTTVHEGGFHGFYSFTEPTPSSAIYDGILANVASIPGGASEKLYIAIQGSSEFETTNFYILALPGAIPGAKD